MVKQVKKNPDVMPCIVFISSISADVSSPSRAEYCISKAALSQAARVFADRLSEYGINVYEVRPGIIQTDMTAPVQEKYDKLIDQGLVPQKRWGFPEDVGKAVASLAKGDFGYSTGLVIEVSGGMNIRHL
jgi:NAD(P)-dependent dehydrogenase (short-subunit alcohol dehydrogenase family)